MPIELKAVALSYDPVQDRILAVVNPGQLTAWSFWLTRRLVLAMMQRIPTYVESTSPLAQQAPADFRSELVAFEREAAMATTANSLTQTPATIMRSSAAAAELADRLAIAAQGDNFRVEIHGERGGEAAGRVARADLQRVLQMLETEVGKAEWVVAAAPPAVAPEPPAQGPKPVRH